MSNTTIPNSWVLISLGKPNQYKIFGSWIGGYLSGDSWRLNSGIKSSTLENNVFIVKGYSGSVYHCGTNNYGVAGSYNQGILEGLMKDYPILELISEAEAMVILNGFISEI